MVWASGSDRARSLPSCSRPARAPVAPAGGPREGIDIPEPLEIRIGTGPASLLLHSVGKSKSGILRRFKVEK